MKSKEDDPFGNVPYLALPTVALFIIAVVVAVGFRVSTDKKLAAVQTPTAIVTESTRVIEPGCIIIAETDFYVDLRCPASNQGPR